MKALWMCAGAALFLVTGCATVKPMGNEPTTIRVVTFALAHSVTLESSSGKPEPRPAFLGGDFEGFPKPIRDSVEDLWAAFPGAASKATGRGAWVGPEQDAHPSYREWGNEEMNPNALIFPAPRSRGFLWPEGFRFLDAQEGFPADLFTVYSGDYVLVVEYRAFVVNSDEANGFSMPRFRMGLVGTLSLFGPDGLLRSRDSITGYSHDTAERRGAKWDRSAYPRLLVQAQEDILREWARRPVFRTGS